MYNNVFVRKSQRQVETMSIVQSSRRIIVEGEHTPSLNKMFRALYQILGKHKPKMSVSQNANEEKKENDQWYVYWSSKENDFK